MGKELPSNWVETELENLFQLYYGKGLSTKELIDDGYDVYGANGIIGKYSDYNQEESKVIISCRGAASGAIHFTNPTSFVTSNSIILDEKSQEVTSKKFTSYMMRAIDKKDVITGTAQPQITIQLLKNLKFRLAPLPEQQRIVAKLDNLFAHLEEVKTRLEKVPEFLKQFRQSVLTQAVTGKLTEDWRKGKSLNSIASTIKDNFANILRLSTDLKKFMKAEGPQVSEFGNGWVEAQFYNLCVLKRGFDLPSSKRDIEGKYVIASSAGIISNHSEYKVQEGVVVGRSGSVGSVHYIDQKHWPLNTTLFVQDFCGNNLKFVYYFLLNFDFLKYSSSTAVPTLNRNHFINEKIKIPSLEEQTEIVRRVEGLFVKVDAIEAKYEQLKTQIDNLPQAILAKAFKGELVEQLPSDGDARELLAEIRKLKKQNNKKK